MLKLILLFNRIDLWVKLSENDGVHICRPLDPLWGSIPRTDSAPISASNEPIFTILLSFYGFQTMPSPFMVH